MRRHLLPAGLAASCLLLAPSLGLGAGVEVGLGPLGAQVPLGDTDPKKPPAPPGEESPKHPPAPPGEEAPEQPPAPPGEASP
jgi:hypothetical protein